MSKEIKAWQCEKCGSAWMNKEAADRCCKDADKVPICRVCGREIDKCKTICFDCLQEERYQKGTKIKYSQYKTEWLYDDTSERYFENKEVMEEYYYDIGTEMPKWCFGCSEIDFSISIESALESAGDNMYEDFDYETESVDLQELLDFVKKWNAKQNAQAFESDYKQIILLNE